MTAAAELATYEALLALPEGERGEVLGGVLRTAPSPRGRHARAQRVLGAQIGGPFDDEDGLGGPGGWWILMEIDVRLGPHDIVRPDVVGWRRERLADPWDQLPIEVVPDWIAEITSPTNAAHDRVIKRALYAKHEVPHYWIVDPLERVLEAPELRQGRWVELGTWGEGATAHVAPFEEVELEVGRLFPPRPRAGTE